LASPANEYDIHRREPQAKLGESIFVNSRLGICLFKQPVIDHDTNIVFLKVAHIARQGRNSLIRIEKGRSKQQAQHGNLVNPGQFTRC
jgi:hypothetical protein